jgi:membrane protein YdbS with pleckstrin-like domain
MKLGVFVGLAIALVIGAWRIGLARHARTRFALDEHSLRIRRGILWRSETVVPRSRVQHTDVNRGPLDRRLGLATLKVFTAGTKLASLGLDGLPDARAVELRNALIGTDDGIDDDAR